MKILAERAIADAGPSAVPAAPPIDGPPSTGPAPAVAPDAPSPTACPGPAWIWLERGLIVAGLLGLMAAAVAVMGGFAG